jgi:hypothetical protein
VKLDDVLDGAAAVPEPSPMAVEAGRSAVRTAIAARTDIASARTRRYSRRRVGVLAGVTAAVAAAVITIPTVGLGGHHPTVNADAADVLRQAGVAAGQQPGGWPNAEFWHSVSTYSQDGAAPSRREIWIGHHRAGVLKDPGVDSKLVPIGVADFPAGSTGLSWDDLYRLPTDAKALTKVLRADIKGAGPNDDAELFTIVGDLLRESPAPPVLRRALYEVAAGVPGVKLVGSATDSLGRPGTAVERDEHQYLISTKDGALLQETSGNYVSTYVSQGPTATEPTR